MRKFYAIASVLLLLILLPQCKKGSGGGDIYGTWQWSKTPAGGGAILLTFGQGESKEDVVSVDLSDGGTKMTIANGTYRIGQSEDKSGSLTFYLDTSGEYQSSYLLDKDILTIDGELYNRVNTANGGRVSGQIKITGAAFGSTLAPNVERSVATGQSSRFIPGQVIVQYREDPGQEATSGMMAMSIDGAGESVSYGSVKVADGMYMLMIDKPPLPSGIQGLTAGLAQVGNWSKQTTSLTETIKRTNPNVLYAAPNYLFKMHSSPSVHPNDQLYDIQWTNQMINMETAWAVSRGEGDVIVAVVDSGWVDHPDLPSRTEGHDFVVDSCPASANPNHDVVGDDLEGCSRDGNGVDADPTDPGDGAIPPWLAEQMGRSSSWHGTHIAGIIGARGNNTVGIPGINWGAKIMPCRAIGMEGMGSMGGVIACINYVSRTGGSVLPARKADVINLSLGDPLIDENGQADNDARTMVSNSVRAALNQGIVVVAASGNYPSDIPVYPAAVDGVVGVSSADRYANMELSYSYRGELCDILASGGDPLIEVLSTIHPSAGSAGLVSVNGYGPLHGTSQAAAFVSGAASLLISAAKERSISYTSDSIVNLLYSNARDIGQGSLCNHGLLDVGKAIVALTGESVTYNDLVLSVQNRMTVTPAFADSFGYNPPTDSAKIFVFGGATGSVTVSADQPWLTATVAGDTINVSFDRTGLSDGEHEGMLTVTSGSRRKEINITLVVDSSIQPSADERGQLFIDEIERLMRDIQEWQLNHTDVGTLYVMLLDTDTNEVSYIIETGLAADYRFVFEGVKAGRYFVVAGTNNNGSSRICDSGDICSAYPSLASPDEFQVGEKSVIADLLINY